MQDKCEVEQPNFQFYFKQYGGLEVIEYLLNLDKLNEKNFEGLRSIQNRFGTGADADD